MVRALTGRTWRATSVPVSTLIRAAMVTADGDRVVAAGGRMAPPTVPPGLAWTLGRTRSMPLVGPPVMTGSPLVFCQVALPSEMVA